MCQHTTMSPLPCLLLAMVLVSPVLSIHESPSPHIGRGFYLPDNSIYRLSVEGKVIFNSIPDSCYRKHSNIGRNKATYHPFPTPADFYEYLGRQLGLQSYEVLPHNFYETLVDVSESINLDLKIVGAAVEITREVSSYQVDPDCLTRVPLNSEMISDLTELSGMVSAPHLPSSWRGYDTFIKKYGTHYIKAAVYGNRAVNFAFSKTSLGYTESQIHAAACSKLRNAGLTFCSQFNDTDYDNAATMETAEFYEVRGWSAEARVNMTVGNPGRDAVSEFMESTTDDEQHIRVILEPITEFLKRRFLGSEHFVKVLNMQQYYEGFLSRACFEQHIHGVVVRRFTQVSDMGGIPEYKCQLARTGCRSDKDCHLSASSMWTSCYCHGESCIVSTHITPPEYGVLEARAALLTRRGSAFEGDNMSCHYKVGPKCVCDRFAHDHWDQAWPGPDSHFTADLQMYRDMHNSVLVLANSTTAPNSGQGREVHIVVACLSFVFMWVFC